MHTACSPQVSEKPAHSTHSIMLLFHFRIRIHFVWPFLFRRRHNDVLQLFVVHVVVASMCIKYHRLANYHLWFINCIIVVIIFLMFYAPQNILLTYISLWIIPFFLFDFFLIFRFWILSTSFLRAYKLRLNDVVSHVLRVHITRWGRTSDTQHME